MMQKIFDFVEKVLMPPMTKLSEQRHLRAVRNGVVATIPLIIIGSFFLVIAFPPISALKEFVKPYMSDILLAYRLTMGLMSLYATFGIGYNLAKSYDIDKLAGGLLATSALLLTIIPQNIEGSGWMLPMNRLGGSGLFVGIIMAFFAVEILRILKEKDAIFKMPDDVPDSVARSFESLIPAALIIVVVWGIVHMIGFNIHNFIMQLFKPLITAGDTYIGVLVPIIFVTLLWAAGIHGISVVGAVARPIWLSLLDENVKAASKGAEVLPHIVVEPFFQWFVWIGGAGATLSLIFLMLFSKSDYLKKLAKASLIPGLCNINEPLIFGAPIMLNPLLAIPFILGPIVTGTLSYIAMSLNLVARPSVLAPWTLPAPIGAYIATGGDWRSIILVLVNIIIMTVIYYPFFKAYEKKLLNERNKETKIDSEENLKKNA